MSISKRTSYSKRQLLRYSFHDRKTRRRLPTPPFLMVDRVTEISPEGGRWNRGYLVAEKDIHRDEWYFKCHFKGDPVMPGVLGVDALLQLTGFFLMHLGHDGYGRALGGSFRFFGQTRPDSKLLVYRLDFRKVMTHPQPTAFAEGEALVQGKRAPGSNKPAIEMKNIMVALFPDLPSFSYS